MATDIDILREAETWYPMDVDERDYVPADFADQLEGGETLLIVTSTCEAIEGTDPSASSRKDGAVGISGTEVRQFLLGVLVGVVYLVRFTATTSSGRVLVIAGHLPVVREGGTPAS